MNDFVDECRREWKRLGVPPPRADEMAAELAADLAEAEAEGASAEDVLGAAAANPRAFAHAWAVEGGVIRSSGGRRTRRLLTAVAIAAFAIVAIAGVVLVVVSSHSEPRRQAVASPDGLMFRVIRGGEPGVVAVGRTYIVPPGARGPLPAAAPAPVMISVGSDDSGFDARIPGLVLLIVGLAGVLTLTSFALRAARPATS